MYLCVCVDVWGRRVLNLSESICFPLPVEIDYVFHSFFSHWVFFFPLPPSHVLSSLLKVSGRLLSAPCVLPDALCFIVWMAVSACAFVYNMCGLMAFCACLRIMEKRCSGFFGGGFLPLCRRQTWPEALCFQEVRPSIHPILMDAISQECSEGFFFPFGTYIPKDSRITWFDIGDAESQESTAYYDDNFTQLVTVILNTPRAHLDTVRII